MDNSNDELEEEENEWNNSCVDSATFASPVSGANKKPGSPHRVILHFDLDCFYAQVEMLRNPALADVPLGIQQKYIVVTSNYVARERGVNKLMSVTDAKEKCPDLVLVKGEDLTHYREMSYKVTELLMSYCPLVQRLGFDENFLDVTEMVESRLAQTTESDSFSFKGHVYNHLSAEVKASDHPRLALGSHIAAELREDIHSKLGLTGCAGIATSKLLAKLVSGTFKPNQQSTLLQEDVSHIMGCLSSLRKVPGVGHQTAKRLQALGLVSVKDLQLYPLNDLVREFGSPSAQRLKNLALGVDDMRVTPTGAPQSLSDEDSFKKISSAKEVLEKIRELLSNLVERMHKDGRQPQTFRLTIRRYTATNKWFSRESRQCPIPSHIGQKIISGSIEDAVVLLVPVAVKLFHKMIDSGASFHLTLINVCFSNLQSRGAAVSGKGAITAFFTHHTSPRRRSSQVSQDGLSLNAGSCCSDRQLNRSTMATQPRTETTTGGSSTSEAAAPDLTWKQRSVVAVQEDQKESCAPAGFNSEETTRPMEYQVPPNVDSEVFKVLPKEIQKELLSPFTDLQNTEDMKEVAHKCDVFDRASSPSPHCSVDTSGVVSKGEELDFASCEFPGNVDATVFSELPPDIQRELRSEWRQQKPLLKTPSSRKPDRSSTAKDKDRKTAGKGKGNQSNNLFKYFTPS